jgi:protein-S-isoprenylcysteine O-methyltransferase Ste14
VVSGGPYALIRHPGYVGALFSYLGTPLFLDGGWSFLVVAFLTGALVLRTSLEDRTLQEELPGYREYAGEVRSRLIPGIW